MLSLADAIKVNKVNANLRQPNLVSENELLHSHDRNHDPKNARSSTSNNKNDNNKVHIQHNVKLRVLQQQVRSCVANCEYEGAEEAANLAVREYFVGRKRRADSRKSGRRCCWQSWKTQRERKRMR